MSRTSDAAVIDVLQGDYDAARAPSLTPFIATAAVLVDDLVSYLADRELTAFSAGKLEMLERWLAAHFYVQGDPGYTGRSTAGGSGQFTGQFGMALENSRYGQQAIVLDSSGYLRSLNKGRKRVGAAWLGKTASEELSWDERN